MTITDVRVREVSIPRVYDTYCADPKLLQAAVDHSRSRYQIIELFTDDGRVGLGEVSDIANRMNPLSAADLRTLLADTLHGGDMLRWRNVYEDVAAALPAVWHPELRSLTLFGVEIALLDLVGKHYGVPMYELLGGRYHDHVDICWVAYLRGDVPLDEELRALREEITEKTGKGLKSFKLKVGEGIAGWVVEKGEPVVIQDVSRDERFSDRFDRLTGFKTKAMICVPLILRNKPIGALQVLNKKSKAPFTQADLELLNSMAQQISIAMENAKLYQRLEEKFELTEKELKTTQETRNGHRLACLHMFCHSQRSQQPQSQE